MLYQWLADGVLIVHVAVVLFVVLGLVLTVVGGAWGWQWVRNRWFRIGHLLTIAIVVLQAWLGVLCPLTTLEVWLRGQAAGGGFSGSFIGYWLQRLLYYQAPEWFFVLAYTGFALLVILVWWRIPPDRWR
ncbi:DUF2784 domain-containing protein [Marinobacter zhejiangensis]|uniref:DUF2784 domain-containing protein n=1 Tax=Marinobacter zhejiangensis TaxID=488535 RepID=A0A1I4NC06_9GAMM|nr:DUF2784 domain-containing protein [Marinobacter zhejiangensis]SFM13018.1 Protein of Unknown function [Marinobacter zhejiangensis]